MSIPEPGPSRRGGQIVRFLRESKDLLIPLAILMLGLGIALASLASDAVTTYSGSFAGTLGPGNRTLSLPPAVGPYVQVNLSQGSCALRIYLATTAESDRFNSSGQLPSRSIDCTNRMSTTDIAVNDFVVLNRGTSAEAYNVTVYAYAIETPYAWIALPGAVLALVGLVLLVPRVMLREAIKLRDEFDRTKRDRPKQK